MNSQLKELMRAYRDKFGEPVPLFELPDMESDELIKLLQKCIKKDKTALEIKPKEDGMIY